MDIEYKLLIVLVISMFAFNSVIVSAEENGFEPIELGNIVVTPNRMTQHISKTSSNVTVINREEIENSNAQNISEVLQEKAGLNVYNSSSVKTVKVDIRGFADTSVNNVLVLVDGRKVNSIDISGPDWMQISLESVERIEVIRGAGSVLYGDNAVSGVVNIITKKGKGKFSLKTGIKAGSYNTNQENVEISGKEDKFSYYLFSQHYDTDGYRSNSDVLSKNYNLRLGYDLYDNTSLDLIAGWHKDNYGMPGGLNDQGELKKHGRRGSVNEEDYASTKDRYVKFSVDTRPDFSNINLNNFKIDIFYRNRDAYSWFDYGVWGARATKYMIDIGGFNSKYIYKGVLFDKGLNFVTGIDYYDVKHTIKGSGKGISTSTDDITIFKEELGFYANSDYELLNDFFINSGMRYQKADYRFDQKAATVRYEARNPTETVLSGGFRYNYNESSNVYFNIQETFRFLATDEWYSTWTGLNTSLKHQKGIQYEAGIRHKFNDTLVVNFTPYLIDIKDEIYLNPSPYPGQNENYDDTRRKGIELSSKINLLNFFNKKSTFDLDEFSLNLNCTYQDAEFKNGDYKGNGIPMVPKNLVNIGINIGFLEKYKFSLLGRYVGSRYAINDTRNETPKVKDYFTLDSRISYNNNNFEIYAAINNILAEEYSSYVVKSASSDSKDYYPAPERNFEVGISYRF